MAVTLGTSRRGRGAITAALLALAACSSSSTSVASTTGGTSLTTSGTALASTTSTTAMPTTPAPPTVPTQTTVPPQVEQNPPGDIPDNQVFVPYSPPAGRFSVKVPEGWAQSNASGVVTFTDKYNSVRIESVGRTTAPTVASATAAEVPAISKTGNRFVLGSVSPVTRAAGPGVLITYLADSPPNEVTAKVARLAVERYEFWNGGTEVVLTLSGPVGADNVDPWRTVTDSLRWI